MVIESLVTHAEASVQTLSITEGSLAQGQYVVAGMPLAPLRIIEDFQGNTIHGASFSSPIMVAGSTSTRGRGLYDGS